MGNEQNETYDAEYDESRKTDYLYTVYSDAARTRDARVLCAECADDDRHTDGMYWGDTHGGPAWCQVCGATDEVV